MKFNFTKEEMIVNIDKNSETGLKRIYVNVGMKLLIDCLFPRLVIFLYLI